VKRDQSLYVQIKQSIIDKIKKGYYSPGLCLPSERDLCVAHNASRMTVRQAINELFNEGYVYKIQGKGTFVSGRKLEQDLAKLTSFSYDMKLRGLKPGSRNIRIFEEKATVLVAENLQLTPGKPVIVLERLRTADNEPLAIQRSYLVKDLFSDIEQYDFQEQSLYELMEKKKGIVITKALQSLETIYITDVNAALLEIPNNSIGLFMRRQTFSSDMHPVEYVESIYRGDKYIFYFEMHN
jgi:GntR family transcriptional regulator